MTTRPGRLKANIAVNLPRPRSSHEITTTQQFASIKHEVLGTLRDEIMKAYGSAKPSDEPAPAQTER